MHDSSPTGATSPLIGYLFRGCLLATGGRKRQTAVGLKVAGGGGRLAKFLQNFEVLGVVGSGVGSTTGAGCWDD